MNKVLWATFFLFAGGMAITAAEADDWTLLYKAPPVPAGAPAWSWTGLYVGGYVGAARDRTDWTNFKAPGAAFGDANSFLLGGKIGSNWQSGRFVVGVEADASAFDPKGMSPCPGCASKSIETMTGRVGVTVDHTLFYLKGGSAWMQ
jgi:outer membrane immunogenic protein